MNRADRMLECLSHPAQEWWTRHELFTRGGSFYLTNNAASELRERGYVVEQRYHQGNVEYRLLSDGREASGATDTPTPLDESVVAPIAEGSDGQLAFDTPVHTYERVA